MTAVSVFYWDRVKWGQLNEVGPLRCGYCEAGIPDDETPLMLCCGAGHVARFCAECQIDVIERLRLGLPKWAGGTTP